MSFAKDFLTQLQEGNTSDAIDTIKESLKEKRETLIEEQRKEILSGYGFVVEQENDDEDDDKEKDKDKNPGDDDKDKDGDDDDKEKDKDKDKKKDDEDEE